MKILFLGAGKRLSLFEAFARSAAVLGVDLECHSVEMETRVPIAGAARIHLGPRFLDPGFPDCLAGLVERLGIDLVVPNMDSATVALARMKADLERRGCWAVVSAPDLCAAMYDKVEADAWFQARAVPVPGCQAWPRIAKHRLGFGSRDQAVLAGPADEERFFQGRSRADYLVQSFVPGPEFSLDAYVDRAGRVVDVFCRRRLQVVDGEVEVSESARPEAALALAGQVLAHPGWQGPVTLQVIQGPGGPVLVEVNPRFGGGVTHAIHCGLDMPRWLLEERLGRAPAPGPRWPEGSLMTRCRRDIFHDPAQ